jgi:hypothetical protein
MAAICNVADSSSVAILSANFSSIYFKFLGYKCSEFYFLQAFEYQ